MKMYKYICIFLLMIASVCGRADDTNLEKAEKTMDAIHKHYGVRESCLFRETYPFDDKFKADYLASDEAAKRSNPYSYLWPFSGVFSAVSTLYRNTNNTKYSDLLDNKILKGLDEYLDNKRVPTAYASYINSAAKSDRFYDDNVWLVIDFAEIYIKSKNKNYLDKAEEAWTFVLSGWDEKIGGGIYWKEQRKTSKNTCSNAPSAVAAMKLYEATNKGEYLNWAKKIYEWTKNNLEDTSDHLYFDNKKLDGQVDKAKYSYNSGQMLQAAVLLYNETKNENYLIDAKNTAEACFNSFFSDFDNPNGERFKILKKGNVWFHAIMLRGFIALYQVDKNRKYIDAFQKSVDYAWSHARDETGLFNQDMSGMNKDKNNWLLTQAAMVEMYAALVSVSVEN